MDTFQAGLFIISFISSLSNALSVSATAIQFVLSDEFSHMRPEERQQLLHVSPNTCLRGGTSLTCLLLILLMHGVAGFSKLWFFCRMHYNEA